MPAQKIASLSSLRHDPRVAYLLVNLATLLWSSNVALGRFLRDQVGPVTLSAARFTLGSLLFAVLLQGASLRGDVARTPFTRRDLLILAGMGLCGVFTFPILLYLSLRFTTATNAALINGTGPLLTLLLAALFLGERVNLALSLGGLISLTGVVLLISGGAAVGQLTVLGFNRGDGLALLAVGLWGLYSILGRQVTRRHSSLRVSAVSSWMALPLLLVAAVFEWRVNPPHLTSQVVLSAVYIGIFPTVIAFLSWNEGVRRVGPNQAMAFYNTLPVFGTLLGYFFLGESLSAQTMLGGLLVIGGGLIAALYGNPPGNKLPKPVPSENQPDPNSQE